MDYQLLRTAVSFFGRMIDKLEEKSTKCRYDGWNDAKRAPKDFLMEKLYNNMLDEDWVDVANIAMMLDERKSRE